MYYREQNTDTYFEYYTIKSGDSLYKIAKKYNINPSLLASMNGFDINDYIYPGQVLLIPNQNYSYYITKSGDPVDTVLNTLKEDSSKLLKENKNIFLLEGQMIVKKKNWYIFSFFYDIISLE